MTTRLTPEPEGERRGRSRRFTETDLPALLLFAVLSLEVTTWFSGQKPLGWGDSGLGAFFYMPGTLLHVYNGAWNPMSGVGEPSGQLVTMLPAALFFAVMQSLHVSAWVAQAIFYWLIQVGASWWAYLFAKELLGEIGGISVPAVAAGLFLNFSTLVMVSYWYLGAPNVEMVAFIPLVALLAVRAGRGQYTILGFALRGLLVADVFSCCFWKSCIRRVRGAGWLSRLLCRCAVSERLDAAGRTTTCSGGSVVGSRHRVVCCAATGSGFHGICKRFRARAAIADPTGCGAQQRSGVHLDISGTEGWHSGVGLF